MQEPLTPADAKALALEYIEEREVLPLVHAIERMTERRMTAIDCLNVIRGGTVTDIRKVKGTWRYRFETETMYAVVMFGSEETMLIVTAVRKDR